MKTEGIRWTGESIPRTAIGECDVRDCGQIAFKEECNAEGEAGRMHWHGTLHVISPKFGGGKLCPKHAEECRQEWADMRKKRQP